MAKTFPNVMKYMNLQEKKIREPEDEKLQRNTPGH